ncbi:MAG: 50S ribosomal protein L1 [Candidatus Neomarinimicrobiota bacterium]|nr:MAG: 50S ribosomal protein L1 [Candidatus Neomarinimicrobiota bacterium]
MFVSKNQKAVAEKIDRTRLYELEEAINLLKELSFAKFDETLELHMNLGVEPRHADQNIRVSTTLPHGTGKEVKVLVVTTGPKEKEAEEAGADYVGKEYLEKIKAGWTDVDKIVATPDMMPELGKMGKILGPRGLMPNPKSGTVTMDIAKAVKELKAGKIELRVDKSGIIHAPCGRLSFDTTALAENVKEIYTTIMKAKPASVKGTYLKKMSLSSTMGPGLKIDHSTLR